MLKLANLKRKFKDVEFNGVKYQVKKVSLGAKSAIFAERYEGCRFEKDPKTDAYKLVEGKVKNTVELSAQEMFHGLADWGLIKDDGEALPLTEANCLEFSIHYPDDAKFVLDQVEEFNESVEDDNKKKD